MSHDAPLLETFLAEQFDTARGNQLTNMIVKLLKTTSRLFATRGKHMSNYVEAIALSTGDMDFQAEHFPSA